MNAHKRSAKPVALSFLEASLKRSLRRHLRAIGFGRNSQGELVPSEGSKESYRALHSGQRQEVLHREQSFTEACWPSFRPFFANGEEVDPRRVIPRLELVAPGTWQSDLFRLVCLTW